MEGRRDEYMSNKGRVHAMFAECLENAFLQLDSDVLIIPSRSSSPTHVPSLDSSFAPTIDSDPLLQIGRAHV